MGLFPATRSRFDLTSRVVVANFTPVFTGNYSNVYQGTFEGKLVAVKVIRATGDPHSMRRKVSREITIWASLDHQNIHPFYGFANDQSFAPFGALVSPWYARGDASKFLKEHGPRMSEGERMKLWSGVVEGVAHLHQNNPAIVHGDLKPGNILIDDSGQPRVCDFGLSQVFLDETDTGLTTTSEHTGTERYLAPELVASELNVFPTTLSDVYAVGCLGLEIVYLQRPYSHRKNNLRGHIIRDLRRGIPPVADPPEPWSQAWLLLRSCWNQEPELRPSASILVQSLRHLSEALPAAISPMRDSRDQKSHDDTEKRQLEELEEQTGILGAEHLDAIAAASALAATYRDQGRWSDAEKLALEVLEKRTIILGAEHPKTIGAAASLANIYHNQGRWDDAEKLELEVLEKRTRILGAEHLDTITAASALAATYRDQGRWSDAEKLALEVLEKRTIILGAEHPKTIGAAASLANIFCNQGRWNDAEKLELEVLEKRARILGAEHLDTIAALSALAATYRERGRWSDAEKLALEVLEKRTRILGAEHPRTIGAAASLANIYHNQGRWDDAEKLELEVLEKQTRILGAEHLDTITAANDLAATYRGQGRWKEAEKLKSKMIVVKGHQHTVRTAAHLASIQRQQESRNRNCIVV